LLPTRRVFFSPLDRSPMSWLFLDRRVTVYYTSDPSVTGASDLVSGPFLAAAASPPLDAVFCCSFQALRLHAYLYCLPSSPPHILRCRPHPDWATREWQLTQQESEPHLAVADQVQQLRTRVQGVLASYLSGFDGRTEESKVQQARLKMPATGDAKGWDDWHATQATWVLLQAFDSYIGA